MNVIAEIVKNPVKVAVAVLLVTLFGVIAIFEMPMQLTPEVETPTLTIETFWPGASPQEVEREIVQEQEEQLNGVEGMRKMSSESIDSRGRIMLEFDVGTDMNEAMIRVNSRLQQVREYPEEADQPTLSTSSVAERSIAWFILRPKMGSPEDFRTFAQDNPDLIEDLQPIIRAASAGLRYQRLRSLLDRRPELRERLGSLLPPAINVHELRRFSEDFIESRFERVNGVSNSEVTGGREEELQVILDPQQLASRQLTVNDVRQALSGRNMDTSGGDLWEGKYRYVVRTLGQFNNPEQVSSAILARHEGKPVYVRDVAEVRLGFKKPDGIVYNFGAPAIAINCARSTGSNVLDVMQGLREANQQLNEGILAQRGLILEQVYDETDYIYSAVGLVQENIIVGGILTVLTLLVFLREGRSTLVIALAIPTSIVGTFLIMHLMGRSLNVISLAGLAFAVGMLVDNAVVVLENIFRLHQEGNDRWTATIKGAAEVWGAVVASTLTTLAVFLPILFIKEEAGQLFRDIAIAISAAIGLSMLVSITVIPAAAARILSHNNDTTPKKPRPGILGIFPRFLDRFGELFIHVTVETNRSLQKSVSLRLFVVGVLVFASTGISYLLLPKVEYLPSGNRNLVFGLLFPPPGYNLDRLTELGENVTEKLRPYWDVDPDSPEAAKLDGPIIGDFFFVARGKQLFLGLRAANMTEAANLVPVIAREVNQFPGIFGTASQSSLFERGFMGGRSIDVEITGPEITKLVALGGQIFGQSLKELTTLDAEGNPLPPQIRPIPSLDLSSPELHVNPKWEQAAELGISAVDLGYAVNALIDGAKAADYYTGGDKIDLTIVGQEDLAKRTQDLAALPLATPDGLLVPLAAVATITPSSGPEQINHRERQRTITIQVTPAPQIALEDAMDTIRTKIIQPLIDSGELGSEYQINLGGTADKLRQTWTALRFNFLLALLITYLLMAALFESWLYPFVIILSVPLGAVGGIAALRLLNLFILQPLDILTMLGFVILIGTVVNNPILIVHHALILMREEGMPHQLAILDSVRTRIRPIFMTTMTTVLGLAPLVFFPGAGSELYRGLGSVVLGGLLSSTFFTLVLVPTLFSLTLEGKEKILGLFFRSESELPPLQEEEMREPFSPLYRPK